MSAAHKTQNLDSLILARRRIAGLHLATRTREIAEFAFLYGLLDPPIGDLADGDADIGGVQNHGKIVAIMLGSRRIAWKQPNSPPDRKPAICTIQSFPAADR